MAGKVCEVGEIVLDDALARRVPPSGASPSRNRRQETAGPNAAKATRNSGEVRQCLKGPALRLVINVRVVGADFSALVADKVLNDRGTDAGIFHHRNRCMPEGMECQRTLVPSSTTTALSRSMGNACRQSCRREYLTKLTGEG